MSKLVWVNPLRPGKLAAYKQFCATNAGPKKAEYIDLLKRYGLKDVEVYYHKLGEQEFVMVIHNIEADAMERLAHFAESKNPYDQWFTEQLKALHNFEEVPGAGVSEYLLNFHYS